MDRRFQNVELLNGAVLTHSDTTLSAEYGLDIEVWTLTVDSTSRINVDGRGYLGGRGAGEACTGQTIPDKDGSTYRSGGSYGGLGGAYESGIPNDIYWKFHLPCDCGSGGSCGGNNYNAGGDGGGRIQISAIEVGWGRLSANGLNGTNWQAGSGSGGSIKMVTSTLSGNGIISANGASHEVGGGGGRIAVYLAEHLNEKHL